MLRGMELGVATFADLSSGISPEQRMRNLMEEVRLADQLGLDVFAIGEHHREDFLISSPAIALAAAAVTTERIRLSSAVTVLSSDDPVRVFQDFAEVDLLSGGRAEIMAGRGSFIESFPLFGYDLKDYDELYAEKLDLLLQAARRRARHLGRPPPRAARQRGRVAAARAGAAAGVGGRRRLAAVDRPRRARWACPWSLAIIGGQPERFVPLVDLYREAGAAAGHDPEQTQRRHQHARLRRRDLGAGRRRLRRARTWR